MLLLGICDPVCSIKMYFLPSDYYLVTLDYVVLSAIQFNLPGRYHKKQNNVNSVLVATYS